MIFLNKSILISVIVLFYINTSAQIISCYAGGGSILGDGGPATNAQIIDPAGCVFDNNGNLIIASSLGGNRIRKIDSNGTITTIAGNGIGGYTGDGGQATAAKINMPVDITNDLIGDIYFSDAANNVIRKIDTNGIITTFVGNGTQGFWGDGGPATLSELYDPNGICLDNSGNLYICDAENNRIRKVNTSGIISTFAGTGIYGFSGDGGPATAAQLWLPVSVTSDDFGNVYISDRYRIRKVNIYGVISTYAGNGVSSYIGDNITATSAQFCPDLVKMDKLNNLFITDNYNYRVYKIDTSGIFHWIAGNGTSGTDINGVSATASPIYYPCGIAFDKCGNYFVTEVNDKRIRKITYDSCRYSTTYLTNQQETKNETYVFPNPTSGIIEIISNSDSYSLIITDIFGKQLIAKQCNSHQENTDISELLPGLYYILIIDSDYKKTVKKILKK